MSPVDTVANTDFEHRHVNYHNIVWALQLGAEVKLELAQGLYYCHTGCLQSSFLHLGILIPQLHL